MAAGTAYAKRYAGGFADRPSTTSAIDSTFLNAVEAALLQLIAAAPTSDGQVMQWDDANTRYGPAKILNKNVDAAAAIAKSKLDFTGANGIVDADVAGAAAIARSKLNFGAGLVNADISAAAAIVLSKLAGYPSNANSVPRGDGAWHTGGMDLICSNILSVGTQATFDSNTLLSGNIPGGYNHLRVIQVGKTDEASIGSNIMIMFNGDTTPGNYISTTLLTGNGAAASSGTSSGAANGVFCGEVAGSTTASLTGIVVIDIPLYSLATPAMKRSFTSTGGVAGGDVRLVAGSYNLTTAITRITMGVTTAGKVFTAGSGFFLYGIY